MNPSLFILIATAWQMIGFFTEKSTLTHSTIWLVAAVVAYAVEYINHNTKEQILVKHLENLKKEIDKMESK